MNVYGCNKLSLASSYQFVLSYFFFYREFVLSYYIDRKTLLR